MNTQAMKPGMHHFLCLSAVFHLVLFVAIVGYQPDDAAKTSLVLDLYVQKTAGKSSSPAQSTEPAHNGQNMLYKQEPASVQTNTLRHSKLSTKKAPDHRKPATTEARNVPQYLDRQENKYTRTHHAIETHEVVQTTAPVDINMVISNAIKKRIAARFSYPLLARKHGWEGNVVLKLRLESDGKMSDIRIAMSSGHELLDQAALKSAQSSAAAPETARWLAGHYLDLLIPVHYRLTDS